LFIITNLMFFPPHYIHRQTDTYTDKHTQTGRHIHRQSDRHIHRQTYTDRQTDIDKHTCQSHFSQS